jgi:hypothetical protein
MPVTFKASINLPIGEVVEVIVLGIQKGKVMIDKKTTIVGKLEAKINGY